MNSLRDFKYNNLTLKDKIINRPGLKQGMICLYRGRFRYHNKAWISNKIAYVYENISLNAIAKENIRQIKDIKDRDIFSRKIHYLDRVARSYSLIRGVPKSKITLKFYPDKSCEKYKSLIPKLHKMWRRKP